MSEKLRLWLRPEIFGAVTISTNMAGRGTDILLGGNPEFMAAAETNTRDPNNAEFRAALEKYQVHVSPRKIKFVKPADSILWARNGTNRDVSTINFVVEPVVRAIREPRGSMSRWKMISCCDLAAKRCRR